MQQRRHARPFFCFHSHPRNHETKKNKNSQERTREVLVDMFGCIGSIEMIRMELVDMLDYKGGGFALRASPPKRTRMEWKKEKEMKT